MVQRLSVEPDPQHILTRDYVDSLIPGQRERVQQLQAQGVRPRLEVILPTDQEGQANPAAHSYMMAKRRHAAAIGADFKLREASRDAVEEAIQQANEDPNTHGILVELPLPKRSGEEEMALRVDMDRVLSIIAEEKDVDGLRPRQEDEPFDETKHYPAATAAAVLRVLDWQLGTRLTPELGKTVAVIGSTGRLVGKPVRELLKARGIDPLRHDRSMYPGASAGELEGHLKRVVGQSDVIISCVGRPGLISPDMVREDMVIADVGFSVVGNGEKAKVWGDVHPGVRERGLGKFSYTPPIGGVGPITAVQLWDHVLKAAERTLEA